MFKNEYQGGAFFEIFSSQGKDPVAKWKLFGSQSSIWKGFDKEVKSFVFVLEGSSQTIKMQLPKESKQMLGLIQRFLILQLYIPLGQDFSAELLITDLANIKRRLYLSTVHKELSATPLHAKIPLSIVKRKVWCNLCIDLVDFTSGIFKGAVFQSLDGIIVSANCKLRKIYTMKLKPQETEQDIYGSALASCESTDTLPRSCQITTDVDQVTQVLDLTRLRPSESRDDARLGISGDGDSISSRGQCSSQDIRKAHQSHIAFGSKVSGPPPATGRKNSARSPTESTRSTSRHEKSLPQLSPEKGIGPDTSILSPKLTPLSEQKNKENLQQAQRKDIQRQDYRPHPPQEPPTDRSRRLRSAGRKEQTRPALDSSSVGHGRNEDKLSVQIHMSSCENRAQTPSIARANITDEWVFPDTSQDDASKLSDNQHQTDISLSCHQPEDSSQNDTSYPADGAPEDPDEASPASSMICTTSRGKLQAFQFSRDVVSPDLLEHDGRGAQMEDDFYGSDSSTELTDVTGWQKLAGFRPTELLATDDITHAQVLSVDDGTQTLNTLRSTRQKCWWTGVELAHC
ncbi:PREDICTED: uncharacterized protein C3orf67 homolog [Nanorana parkeri]|uniref:uncharacterized protein C3orf67 homolog n=1 Tax=Nanorana parkeri TaxID=125878 RepID=UPI000854CF96|nr:PREDICTED: uncharacterized protein C3orf67 homolog [Nanorana parkeri]